MGIFRALRRNVFSQNQSRFEFHDGLRRHDPRERLCRMHRGKLQSTDLIKVSATKYTTQEDNSDIIMSGAMHYNWIMKTKNFSSQFCLSVIMLIFFFFFFSLPSPAPLLPFFCRCYKWCFILSNCLLKVRNRHKRCSALSK